MEVTGFMLYYHDRRYTIIKKNRKELYDIYDAKHAGKLSHKNLSKKQTDQFIMKRQDFLNQMTHRNTQSISKEPLSQPDNASAGKRILQITEWEYLDAVKTEDLAAKLLEKEDFSNYNYPWLAKVIQLSLEYLTLEDLLEAFRASQIPEEILDICEEQCQDSKQ